MTQQKAWSFAGLFIIALVVSIPFYSAHVLAVSMRITGNNGEAGINRFLNAEGDVWTVKVLISGALSDTISPEDVIMKIGDNTAAMTSCTNGDLGVICEYVSPLADGIPEGEYVFRVIYVFVNEMGAAAETSAGDFVAADGTPPKIEGLVISQDKLNAGININFKVDDKVYPDVPSVGLKLIEIIEADSGTVLDSIASFEPGQTAFDYAQDAALNGKLRVNPYNGQEGFKRIKVRAVDRFGHTTTSVPVSFKVDFVKPEIITGGLNLTDLGRFIGPYTVSSDISVNIKEMGSLQRENVKATSMQAALNDKSADSCDADDEIEGLYRCVWNNVEISPTSSVVVDIVAEDDWGNAGEGRLTQALVPDDEAPVIEYFGSERVYEGRSYIKNGKQRILLNVGDRGAGIDVTGISANLGSLGGNAQPHCTDREGGGLECYWDTSKSGLGGGEVEIGLTRLVDKVGNEGTLPRVALIVDSQGPKIEKFEVYGGEKDYFQSNDPIIVEFAASEASGLTILVDLTDAVMESETTYEKGYFSHGIPEKDGWRVYTEEEVCERKDGLWRCLLQTEPIKSGPHSSMRFNVEILDTAGNEVMKWERDSKNVKSGSAGRYTINLLALSTETTPDYWGVARGYPKPMALFVDLDTTKMTYARMPLKLMLESNKTKAEMLSMELIGCEPGEDAPPLTRSLLYGGVNPEEGLQKPALLVLEFQPFDGEAFFGLGSEDFVEVEAEYDCQLRIYSKVGREALEYPEIQDVKVKVPFAFSKLGGVDENVADLIKDVKGSDFMKFADAVHYLDVVFKWINFIAGALQVIVSANIIVDLLGDTMTGSAAVVEKYPAVGTGWGAALRGSCLVTQKGTRSSWEFVEYIQIISQIFTCNPTLAQQQGGAIGWYGKYQRFILDLYNVFSGRGLMGVPADSLYENMYASFLGLCVPGMAFNINKAREIHCRKIICYGQEVPAGIATIDGCNKLYDLQMCEFYWGPFFDTFLLGGVTYIGKAIQSALSSPLGFISLTEVAACGSLCFKGFTSGQLSACKLFTGINKVLGIINSIVSFIDNVPNVSGTPYCDAAEKIDLSKLVGSAGASGAVEEEE